MKVARVSIAPSEAAGGQMADLGCDQDDARIARKPIHADSASSAQSNLLYLTYIKDYQKDWELYIERYCRAINRLYSLVLGAYISNMDLGAVADRGESDQEEEQCSARWARCCAPGPGAGGLSHRFICRLTQGMPRPQRPSAWRCRLKFGWLSNVIFAIYLAFLVLLTTDTLYLYKYEINRMRLARVQELVRVHGPSKQVAIRRNPVYSESSKFDRDAIASRTVINLGVYEEILTQHSAELWLMLAHLGASYREWGIFCPGVYVIAIAYGLGMYLLMIWLFGWRRKHDVQSNRDHIDLAEERRREDALCEREVLKFLESNRVFASIKAQHNRLLKAAGSNANELLRENRLDRYQKRAGQRRQTVSNKPSELVSLELYDYLCMLRNSNQIGHRGGDSLTCRLLMQMLTSGALRPRNRCNFWLKVRDILQAALNVGAMLFCTGLLWSVDRALSSRALPGFDPGAISQVIVEFINAAAFVYHFTTIIGSNIDQALLVRQVLKIVRESIKLNEAEFVRYVQLSTSLPPHRYHDDPQNNHHEPPQAHPRADSMPNLDRRATGLLAPVSQQVAARAAVIERMNCNFLFALMHYKMFVAQFGPFKSTNRGLFLICSLLMFVLPVVTRVHLPYAKQSTQLHIVALLFSAFYLIPLNFIGVPMCFLHARCQSLFPALSSLMAHTARVRQHEAGARIYNEHAIAVLVKEIWNPKQMLEQFTIQSLGISSSYPNLLKLHFWWGLVLISNLLITQGNNSQAEFFGSFARDPIGVWCFRVV